MNAPRILCVDDERNVLLTLRVQLTRRFPQYQIELAETAAEALDLVEELRAEGVEIPLVIADQIMPGMKGDELLIELHARYPDILAVMLTGQATAENVGNVVNRGKLYRFITKPWHEADLMLTVAEALRRYQQDQQIAQQQAALEQANQELKVLNASLQQQTIDTLRASELKLRQITNAIPGAVYQYQLFPNGEHAFPFVSAGVLELYGIEAETVQTNPQVMWDVLLPGQFDDLAASIEQSAMTLQPWNHEYQIQVNTEVRWINGQAIPARQADGSILWNGILTDVTARKQAEFALQQLNEELEQRVQQRTQDLQQANQQLREQEQFLRSIYEGVQQPIFVTDVLPNGMLRHLSWNPVAEQLLGRTTQEMADLSDEELFGPEEGAAMAERYAQCIAARQPITFEEQLTFHGETHWMLSTYNPLINAEGRVHRVVGTVYDITKRKQAEQELLRSQIILQEKEQFLRGIFQGTENPIFVLDVSTDPIAIAAGHQFRYSGWNAASEKFTRLSSAEVLGKTPQEALGAAVGDGFCDHYRRCLAAGEAIQYEEYVPLPSGDNWTLTTLNPLKNAAGEIVRIVGNALDITNRKRVELALRDSEERFRATFEQAAVGIVQLNLQGQFVRMNQKFCDIVGYSAAELAAKTFVEITHPDDLARDLAYVSQLMAGERSTFVLEKRYLCSDESVVWVNLTVSLVRDAAGVAQYFIAIVEDISDRKRSEAEREQAEQALRESENRYQTLAQVSPVGIFRTNINGDYIYVNKRWCQIAGFSTAAALSKGWIGAIHPDDRERIFTEWYEAVQHSQTFQTECRFQHVHTGDITWALAQATAERNSEGEVVGYVGTITDITAYKQAEAQLQQQEQFLRGIYEGVSFPIFVIDIDAEQSFRYTDWNTAAELATGLSRSSIYGKTSTEIYGTANGEAEQQKLLECLRTGSPLTYEEYLVLPERESWWHTTLNPLRDAEGRIHRFVGVTFDITDRKQAELALHESEEQLRLALMASNQGLYDLDLKTGEAIVSPTYMSMLGYEPDEFHETHAAWLERLHPDDHDRTYQTYQNCLSGQTPDYRVEFRQRLKNGDWKWILSVGKIVAWDELGQPLRLLGTHTDIDDRKHAEAEQQKLVALVENSSDFIGIANMDGIPEYVNAAALNLVGLESLEAAKAVHILDFFFPEDLSTLQQEILPTVIAQGVWRGEFRFRHFKTREVIPVDYSLFTVKDALTGQPKCLATVSRDIRERKQAEAALRQLNAELELRVESRTLALQKAVEAAEAANQAKSSFLANMSHELRTPLNAILGFSQLLSRHNALPLEQQQQISIINRSGEHLLYLINDILEMSKIEAGRVTLTLKNFDLHALIHNLEDLFRLKAEYKGLRLTVQTDSSVPHYVRTDEGKLQQVLTNLLSNAIKFTQQGQVTLNVEAVSVPESASELWLQFAVTDTGSGIDAREQLSLFEPFVQTQTGQQSQEGTGLGLPISRRFVQLMGGDLVCESSKGQGSTFHFQIPVVLVSAQDLPPQPTCQRVIGLAPDQTSYRVLVVEDQLENRLFLVQLLQSVGFDVQQAENGADAVRQYQQWQPHLIWMDMRMPVLDGYAATRQIRALSAQTNASDIPLKIIALTASAFEDERAAILAAGCDDLVCKPATEAMLFEKIAEHLGVRYLYEGQLDRSSATTEPVSDLPAAAILQEMPVNWVNQLRWAARIGDEDLILQLLEQLPPSQAQTAQILREWVYEFQYDKLIEFTDGSEHC